MVTIKRNNGEIPKWADSYLPRNRNEMSIWLNAISNWEEADLKKCPKAMKHLLEFDRMDHDLWPKSYERWFKGQEPNNPETIIVTADGDGILLRASGRPDYSAEEDLSNNGLQISIGQSIGGQYYDWALSIKKLVEPCLKPSKATPPWEKLLAFEAAKNPHGMED